MTTPIEAAPFPCASCNQDKNQAGKGHRRVGEQGRQQESKERNGGDDTLYRADGRTFDSLDGGIEIGFERERVGVHGFVGAMER